MATYRLVVFDEETKQTEEELIKDRKTEGLANNVEGFIKSLPHQKTVLSIEELNPKGKYKHE